MSHQARWTAGFIVLGSLLLSTPIFAQHPIDWKHVPQSQLPSKLADIVCELAPLLSQKKSVLLPLPPLFPTAPVPNFVPPKNGAKKKLEQEPVRELPPGVWNFEAYVAEVFTGLMSASNLALCDPKPCLDLVPGVSGERGKVYAGVLQKIAKKAGADVVLVPRLFVRKAAATLQVTAYDGENGKALKTADCTLKGTDVDYLSNTPKTNRKVVQWVESRFGQKIARGECWDLVAKAIEGIGSSWEPKDPFDFGRRLEPDETPFPGDPLATGNRSHTMMTYRYLGNGSVAILHQNWDWGKESGRKVGWGTSAVHQNDFWRLRPAPGDGFSDLMLAAKARAKEKDKPLDKGQAERSTAARGSR